MAQKVCKNIERDKKHRKWHKNLVKCGKKVSRGIGLAGSEKYSKGQKSTQKMAQKVWTNMPRKYKEERNWQGQKKTKC